MEVPIARVQQWSIGGKSRDAACHDPINTRCSGDVRCGVGVHRSAGGERVAGAQV